MKIIYEGFYGFKNTGDDAFIEVTSWGARNYWNCSKNTYLGESLPTTLHPIGKRQLLRTLKGFDRINLISHLANADYLISAGGSTFGELPFHSNKAVANLFQKARKKLQLGAIGVSVGPFHSSEDEKRVIRYLKSLSFLALRDDRSFQYASSLDLPFKPVKAFDLAALLPKVYKDIPFIKPETHTKQIIGLSICNHERYTGGDLSKEQKRNSYFKSLVNRLAKETEVHFNIFVINGNSHFGDLAISKELVANLNASRYTLMPYTPNVKEAWDRIAACDLVITTRLHAGIFACYANVPFMMLEYHKKCSDFLQDVGQDDYYRLYDADVALDTVLPKIKEVLSGIHKKPSRIAETIALSERNFTETIPKL